MAEPTPDMSETAPFRDSVHAGRPDPAGGYAASAPSSAAGGLSLEGLDKRVAALERLTDLLDLLAVPGLLAARASEVFKSEFVAANIPNEAPGVFPLEQTPAGTVFRWFSFPEGCEIRVPVIAGIPSIIRVVTLEMAHLRTADDFIFVPPEGVSVSPLGQEWSGQGTVAVTARVSSDATRLCGIGVSCRTGLETGGRDARSLGLPFVKAEYRPEL